MISKMTVLLRPFKKYRLLFGTLSLFFFVWFYFSLPDKIFNDPYATVLLDRENNLLNAIIAEDGQWRFPPGYSISEKYKTALQYYEDEYFYTHPGVNPFAIIRAFWQNLMAGEIVSGGSTISMQVIRMSRDKPRTIIEKMIEILLSIRMELRYDKEEVIDMYAVHAPFGGNVVGIGAASWRYFERNPEELTWGEAAMLAVLPNSPGLIHPGKNRTLLKKKRDILLDKLLRKGLIDSLSHELAKEEPLPLAPSPLPNKAPHLLLRAIKDGLKGTILRTTLNEHLQERTSSILKRAYERLRKNEIHNVAAMVTDIRTGKIIAYCGNVNSGQDHGMDVDIISSPRSTGSILKPFLYAAVIEEGLLMPHALIADIPLYLDGFAPKNFSESYDGAVHADEALARSLNIPAVNLLRTFRYEKFHTLLKTLGMTTLLDSPDHYGLSLILGGAEGTLWDIVSMYQDMAQAIEGLQYNSNRMTYLQNLSDQELSSAYPFSKGAIWHTVNALSMLSRPGIEGNWNDFESATKISWKTGTSFGNRDAWSIGITPQYCIGVWVGNADGEGRPGLTGIESAAPILFDIFDNLENSSNWFIKPVEELTTIETCRDSGERASEFCLNKTKSDVYKKCLENTACKYHQLLSLDRDKLLRVTSDCVPVNDLVQTSWFILPPVQEYYYLKKHPDYKTIPPYKNNCSPADNEHNSMQFIYPKQNAKIYIPRELQGNMGKALIEVAHNDASTEIFWHFNDQYAGVTKKIHQMEINLLPGVYKITLVDNKGIVLNNTIEVLSKQ